MRIFPVDYSRLALILAGLLSTALLGCASDGIGLTPIHPRHGESIEENIISLEWEPSDEAADEIKYQLAVFKGEEKTSMYQVELAEPHHVVLGDYEPGIYRWMVRPMFLRNGAWEAGEWSQRKYFIFAVFFFGWGEEMYKFKLKQPVRTRAVPDGKELSAACLRIDSNP